MKEETIYPEDVLKSEVLKKFLPFSIVYTFGMYIVFLAFMAWQFNFNPEKIIIMWDIFLQASLLDKLLISPILLLVLVVPSIYFPMRNTLNTKTCIILNSQGITYKQGRVNKSISWINYKGISFGSNPMFIKFGGGDTLRVLDVFAKETLLSKIETYHTLQSTPQTIPTSTTIV